MQLNAMESSIQSGKGHSCGYSRPSSDRACGGIKMDPKDHEARLMEMQSPSPLHWHARCEEQGEGDVPTAMLGVMMDFILWSMFLVFSYFKISSACISLACSPIDKILRSIFIHLTNTYWASHEAGTVRL